jgi:glycosyltransferase involved in cell wall biosynthesis
MSGRRMVALLGRPDAPTDALEDYCRYLAGGLREHGIKLAIERVPWAAEGWAAALRGLRDRAKAWKDQWVVLQYTALGWSGRGFPQRFLRVVRILREAGARVGVTFHDVEPYGGARLIDRLRRRSQLSTMRKALRIADAGISTVALNAVSWLQNAPKNAHFIPIGANLPMGCTGPQNANEIARCVVVYGITGGDAGKRECHEISAAMSFAAGKLGNLRLHVFGRNALEAEPMLREGLRNADVELRVEGILPAEQVVRALCEGAAMLFVREPISTRRGSALAGIACGLPVVAYRGPQTAAPLDEAGVALVSKDNPAELGETLARVLSDAAYRERLAEQSRSAYAKYFAWSAVAQRYAEILK